MKKLILASALLPAAAFASLQVVDEPAQPKVAPGSQVALHITAQAQPQISAQPQVLSVQASEVKPLAIKPQQVWTGEAGSTLRDTIMRWAAKEKWTVIWDTKTDFPLEAPVRFAGRFDEAAAQFITLYEHSEKPLVADISLQQSSIYITDRK